MLLDALGAVGEGIDKFTGGRALRGALGGHPWELASVLPFSDTLGITDPNQQVSGRDLTDQWGISTRGSDDFGSRAAGFAADMLLNPANIAGGLGAASKASTLGGALLAGGKAMTGLDALEAAGRGLGKLAFKEIPDGLGGTITTLKTVDPQAAIETARSFGARPSPSGLLGEEGALGLKFDQFKEPPSGMSRSDPEWINNRTFYHGTATPNLTASDLDPLKTDSSGLFGRGVYLTDEGALPDLPTTTGYAEARHEAAMRPYYDRLQEIKAESPEYQGAMPRFHSALLDAIHANPANFERLGVDLPGSVEEVPDFIRSVRHSYSVPEGEQRWFRSMTEPIEQAAGVPSDRKLLATYEGMRTGQPTRTIYQTQPNVSKVLDLEADMPQSDLEALRQNLMSIGERADEAARLKNPGHSNLYSSEIKSAYNPEELISAAREANAAINPDANDYLIQALRSAGYDALTHTGGGRWGGPYRHQVLIAIDPNDAITGVGRGNQLRNWEQFKQW